MHTEPAQWSSSSCSDGSSCLPVSAHCLLSFCPAQLSRAWLQPLTPSLQVLVDTDEVTSQPSLFRAEQVQFPQLGLVNETIQSSSPGWELWKWEENQCRKQITDQAFVLVLEFQTFTLKTHLEKKWRVFNLNLSWAGNQGWEENTSLPRSRWHDVGRSVAFQGSIRQNQAGRVA